MAGSEKLSLGSQVPSEVACGSLSDVSGVFRKEILSGYSREVTDREGKNDESSRRSRSFEMPTEVAGVAERSETSVDDGEVSASTTGQVLRLVASLLSN